VYLFLRFNKAKELRN